MQVDKKQRIIVLHRDELRRDSDSEAVPSRSDFPGSRVPVDQASIVVVYDRWSMTFVKLREKGMLSVPRHTMIEILDMMEQNVIDPSWFEHCDLENLFGRRDA